MPNVRFNIFILFATLTGLMGAAKTPIIGEPDIEVEQMYQFVAARNPAFTREVAAAFHDIGARYGVRGDIALCQAIIETGWFRFDNGTAVSPDSHNYCGLGVRRNGERGCSFATIEEGVRAMIQHLYAYACKDDIPEGEPMVDPRFGYVTRGSADSWESLSGRWAMNDSYGKKILALFALMKNHDTRRAHDNIFD